MKPLVLVTAPVATRSGYGSHSRDIVRSLISMDKFDEFASNVEGINRDSFNKKLILKKWLKIKEYWLLEIPLGLVLL